MFYYIISSFCQLLPRDSYINIFMDVYVYLKVQTDKKGLRLWIASGDSESFQLSLMDLNESNTKTKVRSQNSYPQNYIQNE